MLCFICEKPIIVGKTLKVGDYDLIEVDIRIHCATCYKNFSRNKLLQERLNYIKKEMKSHLKEYRLLKREKCFVDDEIAKLNNNKPIEYKENELVQHL